MKHLIPLLSLLLFFGCTPETEKLHSEVMAIHDEVMPHMDDIMKETSRLKGLKENETDSLKRIRIDEALVQLKNADEGMMQWMRQFKPGEYENDEEALINYYKAEKERIEEVRIATDQALENSKSIQ